MAQHDYNIANQTFPNTRTDINNALSAVASNNSGTAAPSTTFANQWFYETDTNLLQIRNEDNDAYITIAELDQSNDTVEYFKSDSIRTALIEFTDGDDAITIADGGGCTFNSGITMAGTTPTLTIGDGGAEDTKIVFDGNAQNFYIGLDDSADDLLIGLGSTVGTTPAIAIDENNLVTLPDGHMVIASTAAGDNLTLKSTNAGAEAGPQLVLHRDSASPANNDVIGRIRFEGEDNESNKTTYAQITSQIIDKGDSGGEDSTFQLEVHNNGGLRDILKIKGASGGTPEIVINEAAQDVDFRIRSQVGTHAFFVNGNASNGCAGFYSASNSFQLMIENQNAPAGRVGLFVQHPSSSDTGTGVNFRTSRSASLSVSSHLTTTSNNGSDIEFNLRGDGNAFCDGSFSGGGADYAEYFEWKDGNGSNEDRVGYSVVLDGNKIVKATDSDDVNKIIGVISANPSMVGDSDISRWKQKFLLDDFGREITEEITVTEWRGEHTTEEGIFNKNYLYSYDTDRIPSDVTVPSDAEVKSVDENGNKFLRRKTNPDWNESETYISREDRKEWETVGLMGKLRLRKGQPTGTNWIKMRDISDTVEEWLVR